MFNKVKTKKVYMKIVEQVRDLIKEVERKLVKIYVMSSISIKSLDI